MMYPHVAKIVYNTKGQWIQVYKHLQDNDCLEKSCPQRPTTSKAGSTQISSLPAPLHQPRIPTPTIHPQTCKANLPTRIPLSNTLVSHFHNPHNLQGNLPTGIPLSNTLVSPLPQPLTTCKATCELESPCSSDLLKRKPPKPRHEPAPSKINHAQTNVGPPETMTTAIPVAVV